VLQAGEIGTGILAAGLLSRMLSLGTVITTYKISMGVEPWSRCWPAALRQRLRLAAASASAVMAMRFIDPVGSSRSPPSFSRSWAWQDWGLSPLVLSGIISCRCTYAGSATRNHLDRHHRGRDEEQAYTGDRVPVATVYRW